MTDHYINQVLRLLKEKKLAKEVAYSLIKSYQTSLLKQGAENSHSDDDKIAVIGMSCRMPSADNLSEFWSNLLKHKDCICPFPEERKKDTDPYLKRVNPDLFVDNDPYWPAGFIDRVDLFDPSFFNIVPGEAKLMDPQQRLFLEVAYEAMEDSGYVGETFKKSKTGVYIGHCDNEYQGAIEEINPAAIPGNLVPFIASRVSYIFDLNGPAISVATTCSSSLTALHIACQALKTGDCEMAIVGATNLYLFPANVKSDSVYTVGISAKDYRCRTFDSKANGVVRGEGSIALILKPYKQAVKDRDQIHSVILGGATNNDGHSARLTAPNPLAQTKLLLEAWENAKIDPESILYIEAHGTGTKLGDPIEVKAINKAFSKHTTKKHFCGLGSIKTNIGHLVGGASGLAGVLKATLSLKHKLVPSILHYEEPNPLIDFDNSAVYVTDQNVHLDQTCIRMGVSAFGFNGTNTHIVLENYNRPDLLENLPKFFILPISANSLSSLKSLAKRFKDFLNNESTSKEILNICYTAAVKRLHRKYRACFIFQKVQELFEKLDLFIKLQRQDPDKKIYFQHTSTSKGKIAINSLELEEIAEHYTTGGDLDWKQYYAPFQAYTVALPHYPYERKRIWISAPTTEKLVAEGENEIFQSKESVIITPSRTQKEKKAVFKKICSDLLGLENLSLNDDFFDLGGDSLLGIQFVNLIHKHFNKKISLEDIFDSNSLNDILKLIEGSESTEFTMIPNLPEQKSYLVSSSQKRLWLLEQMQDQKNAYNMYDFYLIEGEFNLDKFSSSCNHVYKKHEGLRTTFEEIDGDLFQKINNNATFDTLHYKTSSVEEGVALFNLEVKRPLDLKTGPLLKIVLIEITEKTQFILGFVIHHMICDGWSLNQLIMEVFQAYTLTNIVSEISKITYKDYASWQINFLQSKGFEKQEEFWLQKLSKGLVDTTIPGDLSRPEVFNFRGNKSSFTLAPELSKKIKAIAKANQATLYMTLLSTIYLLIYKYTNQKTLFIGSPVSGRTHHDLNEVVGCFVNTLVMKASLDPQETFSTFLASVKKDVLEAFENQDYPFDYLVTKLNLQKDTSKAPLFNINVVLQNQKKVASDLLPSEISVKQLESEHNTSKWDLEFEFTEQEKGTISCKLEYYTGVYSASCIQNIIETYLHLLETLVISDDSPLSQINSLSKKHLQQLANISSKETINSYPNSIIEAFNSVALKMPNSQAVISSNSNFTYQQIDDSSTSLAKLLLSKKVQKGSFVGILMENSAETIISILAVLKAGAAYVPLDTSLPTSRLKSILIDCEATFLISKSEYQKLVEELQWSCSTLNSTFCFESLLNKASSSRSELMNQNLWDYVADKANNDIEASGWVSSFTGQPFSEFEMAEYSANIYNKLKDILSKNLRVLEIGCGSGLTMEVIAPHVGEYVATDLSEKIVGRVNTKAQELNLSHVQAIHVPAHEIDKLNLKAFDLVIINSVIHCFPDTLYLKNLLKLVSNVLLKKKGQIFLGDLMDLDLKEKLLDDLRLFKSKNPSKSINTKLNLDGELFISKRFLESLRGENYFITSLSISNKHFTAKNELNQYRYDALLQIDRSRELSTQVSDLVTLKYQYSLKDLEASLKLDLPPIDNNSIAYVLYTSGSTGKPKGVLVPHSSLINYIFWAISFYWCREDTIVFPFYSSISFDFTLTSIFCPLLSGGTIKVFSGSFEQVIEHIVIDKTINSLKITPAHLSYMKGFNYDLSHLQVVIVGGDALLGHSLAPVSNSSTTLIYNEYGPTEATVGCIVLGGTAKELLGYSNVPIGKPINGTCVLILDELGSPSPIGAIGELYIGGACLSKGYLNLEEKTKDAFVLKKRLGAQIEELFYKTGDLVRLLPSGNLEFLGRKDRQVKLRSFRIELSEIDQVLGHLPYIGDAASKIVTMENGVEALVTYYTSKEKVNPSELFEYAGNFLPKYMLPSQFIHLQEFPLTLNGKIDFNRLPLPSEILSIEYEPPSTKNEKILALVWEKLFSKTRISIVDDFFSLGGDSISAMRMLNYAKKEGLYLSVRDIFQGRTIKKLAKIACNKATTSLQNFENKNNFSVQFQNTPIQNWFLDENFKHPNYFNMAYFFKVSNDVELSRLEQAIIKCIKSHQALRSCYCFKNKTGTLKIKDDFSFHIQKFNLIDCEKSKKENKIQQIIKKEQEEFDLSSDIPIRVLFFDLGTNTKRLLILVHHFVIDGYSWRILLEDLQNFYSLKDYEPVLTSTLMDWLQRLHSIEIPEEKVAYWTQKRSLPPRLSEQEKKYTYTKKVFKNQTLNLSASLTSSLNSVSRDLYKTSIQDVLLGVFSFVFKTKFKQNKLWVNLESLGRDIEVCEKINCDLSRTIGWFTALFPILIEPKSSVTETILSITNTLERIPNQGIYFGIAKDKGAFGLSDLEMPEILFNYFGKVDEDILSSHSSRVLQPANEDLGQVWSEQNHRPYALEINSIIIEGQLQIEVEFNTEVFKASKINEFITDFQNLLTSVCMQLTVQK